ncbi:PEPxxWA-CTERM sorting domain-containing protein [Sphingomonas sp. JC676]|uniref:PEPxxWA-CTERM sorting domain-containing protein n=1 Tax=Sphingomonas sp. JC676 TaxID=2768065 RepID=UPI0016585CC4|nr:PEPxxWA-CTERM sorting domain-containing protein [Sphingomonas sp. JC676]MBC9033068.1 PEPxxWA-CTERM sorting domain-containing protein [Sphingomonas sp. JC676]
MLRKSLLLAACLVPLSAQAQVVTRTFDLLGTDFQVYSGAPSPLVADPVLLNFTLALDPGIAPAGPSTAGLVINSFNLPYALAWSLSSNGTLIIATNGTPGSCAADPNSFCAIIRDAFTDEPALFFLELSDANGGWFAQTRSVGVSDAAVPEPASWGMLVVGFGAIGGAMRYRRRRMAVAFG